MADYGPTRLNQKAWTCKRPSGAPWRIKCSHVIITVTSGLSPCSLPRLPMPKGWDRADKNCSCAPLHFFHTWPTCHSYFLLSSSAPHGFVDLAQLYFSDTMCFLLPGAWGGGHTQRPPPSDHSRLLGTHTALGGLSASPSPSLQPKEMDPSYQHFLDPGNWTGFLRNLLDLVYIFPEPWSVPLLPTHTLASDILAPRNRNAACPSCQGHPNGLSPPWAARACEPWLDIWFPKVPIDSQFH